MWDNPTIKNFLPKMSIVLQLKNTELNKYKKLGKIKKALPPFYILLDEAELSLSYTQRNAGWPAKK